MTQELSAVIRENIDRRIERIQKSDGDIQASQLLRLMGYLEALEDQGLLNEKQVAEFNRIADEAAGLPGAGTAGS